jgi:hypothetical protein
MFGRAGREQRARADAGGFSGQDWTPNADVRACADIISAIINRHPAAQLDVPMFVSQLIQGGQSTHSGTTKFEGLLNCRGVTSEEISDFMREIESFE